MDERRAKPRKRTFLKGTVYFNHRLSSVECVVRDFSEEGARLEIPGSVTVPGTFELDIPARDQTLYARIRWRKGDEIGVSFGSPHSDLGPTAAAGAGNLDQRVEMLEREVHKLQRAIQDLRADMRHIRGE